MATPLAVGLLGAGPWATRFHAPMLAAGPDTRLGGVWARRPDLAAALAAQHGARPAATVDALFDTCDAVAFAVPPDVQAVLAVRAARAGKHLLLEKPLGLTVDEARRVADAVDAAGVVSMLMLTNRFTPRVRRLLAATGESAVGAAVTMVSGAARPGEFFATPWRMAHGALLDVGPHALDLLDAVLGAVESVHAEGDARRWIVLTARHVSGALSQATLSITAPVVEPTLDVLAVTRSGPVRLAAPAPGDDLATATAISSGFAAAVRAMTSPDLDVHRGVYLQELLEQATR